MLLLPKKKKNQIFIRPLYSRYHAETRNEWGGTISEISARTTHEWGGTISEIRARTRHEWGGTISEISARTRHEWGGTISEIRARTTHEWGGTISEISARATHSSEEMSWRWRAVDDAVSDLTFSESNPSLPHRFSMCLAVMKVLRPLLVLKAFFCGLGFDHLVWS